MFLNPFTISFCVLALAISIAFGLGFWWLAHLGLKHEAPELKPLEKAFLLGGTLRVIEFAFFQLVRDGWIKPDADRRFRARLDVTPEGLSVVEQELFSLALTDTGLSLGALSGVDRETSNDLERRLVRKKLLHSKFDFFLLRACALFPLIGCVVYLCMVAGMSLLSHNKFNDTGHWVLLSGAAIIALSQVRRSMTRYTHQGMAVARQVRKDAEMRLRDQRKPAFDGNPTGYDHLWIVSDQILTGGLASQTGWVFGSHEATARASKFSK